MTSIRFRLMPNEKQNLARLAINSLQPVRCYALHGGYLLAVSAYLASQDLVADYDASSRVNSVWFSSETCRHELDTDVRLLLSSADDVMMPASESRLYTFSPETRAALRKFRLGTSRAKDAQAVVYQISKDTLEIAQADDEVYTDLSALGEDLPGHSPRYVLLSYPMTLPSGRLSVPYVMIYYMPVTCNAELRMLYAGAKELMRNTAEVGRVIEVSDAEELEKIEETLGDGGGED
ncbi:MAG: hypothetical protein LQ340_002339 [Diploschistes diacapsis]|nr:MAG: hypothetical protein LQ340_002339 [Diploschistes diacapsis]